MLTTDKTSTPISAIDNKLVKESFKSLNHESDRGAVLVSIAILDEMITTRLEELLHHGNSKTRARFLKSPFSAKVDLLYCLGHIQERIHSDLKLLNRLRNKCAHEWNTFHFTLEIVDEFVEPMILTQGLRSLEGTNSPFQPLKGKGHRDVFLWSMSVFIPTLNRLLPLTV